MKNQIKIYKKAMSEILECCEMRDNYGMIEDIVKDAMVDVDLDEAASNEIEHKVVYLSDVNKQIAKEWKKDG